MDLFLLSYRIQQGRYSVPAELVAEAILRWHRGLDPRATLDPAVLELDEPDAKAPDPPREYARP